MLRTLLAIAVVACAPAVVPETAQAAPIAPAIGITAELGDVAPVSRRAARGIAGGACTAVRAGMATESIAAGDFSFLTRLAQ